MKDKTRFEKKSLALSQILILIIGVVAISYAIGSSVGEVRADSDKAIFLNPLTKANPDIFGSGLDTYAERQAAAEKAAEKAFFGGPIGTREMASSEGWPTMTKASTIPIPTRNPQPATITKAVTNEARGKGRITVEDIFNPNNKVIDIGEEVYVKKGGDWFAYSTGDKVADKAILDELNKKTASLLGRVWGRIKTVVGNAAVALTIYEVVKLIGPMITHDQSAIESAARGAGAGYFIGTTFGPVLGELLGISGTLAGLGLGIIVGVAIFLLTYKKTSEIRIQYTCELWDAQTGGKSCEKCNSGILPCSLYICKSLGQACELINPGTKDQMCIWKNEKDINPPVIKPWPDALLSRNYTYDEDTAISPPDYGVFVEYNKGCIPAFTPFAFGIFLDEPAKCKIDPIRKNDFDSMQFYFGGSQSLKYNHTQMISLPSAESLEAEGLTLQNNGNYELHVRCQDANGRANIATFAFKYCVDAGPDTTPPVIIGTNINKTTPISYNQSTIPVELYVNEPAECKWARERDTEFENMEGTMKCSSSVFEMSAQMLYKCSTTLTGIESQKTNDFYFRCKDKPTATKDRNVNTQGYKISIIGTQPLVLDKVGPEGIVSGSTDTVKVTLTAETSAGYNEGEATCSYSPSCYAEDGSKTKFLEFSYSQGRTSYTHSQDLWPTAGNYNCVIRCVDPAGNTDSKEFSFEVKTDTSKPIVIRVYNEDNFLKIITDEEAECVYSNTDCNYLFKDGLKMNVYEKTSHYTDWYEDKTYYIRCQDKYGNQPFSNACTIVVKPSEA